MTEIITEGVLFVVLLATVATLFYYAVLYGTSAGMRVRQTRNRKRLDRAAELACPIHGPQRSDNLVRLTSGDSICPECYKETVHGYLDR
ncbi:MAG: hypothetical protein JWO05_102 [Gemmatimonadetes bacterium]|nr:hypothetical protein [Gemmatimonadota bacterium]